LEIIRPEQRADVDEDEVIGQFVELVKIQAVSRRERPIVDFIKRFLHEHGFGYYEDHAHHHFQGNAGNLICKVRGNASTSFRLLLAAHVDTVSPSCQQPVIEKGKIRSSDDRILGADDRAGVLVLLQILKRIAENQLRHPDLEIVFLVAEEVGLLGSKYLDYGKISADFGVNFDSSGPVGRVILQAPAALNFQLAFIGREAHSAVNPEEGIHAIKMAAEAIHRLDIPPKEDNTVFNIGTIHGGVGNNVVPNRVDLTGEVRAFEDERILRCLQRLEEVANRVARDFGGRYEMDSHYRYHGFSLDGELPIVRLVRSAYERAAVPFIPAQHVAGSDANRFNHRGIPCVNIGLGYVNNHSSREVIAVEDLLRDVRIGLSIVEVAATFQDEAMKSASAADPEAPPRPGP